MANDEKHLDQWVHERIANLETPGDWVPDADRGLLRVRRKQRTVRRRRWGVGLAGFAALASALFTIPGCQAATCKVPSENLAERLWKSMFVPPPPAPRAVPKASTPAEPPTVAPSPQAHIRAARNFKLSGSLSAPVTCEIYSDYECPACARLYMEVAPQLIAEYVDPGKVKLLHRDYPLPMHPHSRLAAQYANAAGAAGQYETAVSQIFRTQVSWGLSGDIDAALSEVLAPEVMAKVRNLVRNDPRADDSMSADIEQGREDGIDRTPTAVIVAHGERRVIPSPDYAKLKAELDAALRP